MGFIVKGGITIMQIQNINNSPNFVIKYIKPRKWNPDVLDTLIKSDLVKQIDNKYPNAKVTYLSGYSGMYPNTKRPFSNLYFSLDTSCSKLDIGAKYDDELVKIIKSATLEDLEKEISDRLARRQRMESIYNEARKCNN